MLWARVMIATALLALTSPSSAAVHYPVVNTDVIVKYTWAGDSNLSGVVDFDDYSKIDTGFSQSYSGWYNGDFDYNGLVNFDDYALIDLVFNIQGETLGAVVDALNGFYQEPTSPGIQAVLDHHDLLGNDYKDALLALLQ